MPKGRILYVNQAIAPFTAETEISTMGSRLPHYIQDPEAAKGHGKKKVRKKNDEELEFSKKKEEGRDTRIFMPRFGGVSDRKFQLHEVQRLSGMNLTVDNCDHQLIIKVGSIMSAGRMQVYFIDNEEYFKRPGYALDDEGHLFADTDERILFFGHSVLEAVRKLAWQPNLIHYTGWFSAMVPFYLRRAKKENAFFDDTKTVVTLTDDAFEGAITQDMERKLKLDGATPKDLQLYQNITYINLMKAAITYSNGVVIASPKVDPELVSFAKETKKHVVDYVEDEIEFFGRINKLYDHIIGTKINT